MKIDVLPFLKNNNMKILYIACIVSMLLSCKKESAQQEDNTVTLTAKAESQLNTSTGFPVYYWRVSVNTTKSMDAPATVTVNWTGWDATANANANFITNITIPVNNSGTIGVTTATKTSANATPTAIAITNVTCSNSKYVFKY